MHLDLFAFLDLYALFLGHVITGFRGNCASVALPGVTDCTQLRNTSSAGYLNDTAGNYKLRNAPVTLALP